MLGDSHSEKEKYYTTILCVKAK